MHSKGNRYETPVKVIGQYDKFWLVDTGKDPRGGKKWMFVLKGNVKEVVKPVDDDAFPKDMSKYTKGTRSQYMAMGGDLVWPVNEKKFNMVGVFFGPFSQGFHTGIDISKFGFVSNGYIPPKEEISAHNKVDTLFYLDSKGTVKSETIATTYYQNFEGSSYDNDRKIYSIYSGVVKAAGWDQGMGNYIRIEIDKVDPATQLKLMVTYMHLKNPSPFVNANGKLIDPATGVVTASPKVKKAQEIGIMGTTGRNSTGTHLHMQISNDGAIGYARQGAGIFVNPLYFYPNMKVAKYPPVNDKYDNLDWEQDPKYAK